MSIKHISNVIVTLFLELVHSDGPELVKLLKIVHELIVKTVPFFFVSQVKFIKLPVLEFLPTILPFNAAPLGINVFPILFMADHLFIHNSQALVETQHPAGVHELTHLYS